MSTKKNDDFKVSESTRTPLKRSLVAAAVSLFVLAGCSSSDDNDMDDAANDGAGTPATGDFAVSQNDGANPGNVKFFAGGLASMPTTLASGANQGIAFDQAGNLFHNSDSDAIQGIRALGQAERRSGSGEYDMTRDRMIGSAPGKGLSYIADGDLLVSADVTDAAGDIKVYAASAGANAAPLYVIDTMAAAWDTFYEPSTDRLYAALVDGTLAIVDDFSDDPQMVDRMVIPVDSDGMQVSVNFHGVFVEGNTVLVSDVGAASSPTDGSLFTFTDDGSIDGETTQYTTISGPATMLGNPVDAVLSAGSAVIAEKSNDQVLVFDAITSLSGDVAPSSSVAFSKPESVEYSMAASPDVVDATDIESPMTMLANVAVSLNPGPAQEDGSGGVDNGNVGAIRLLGADLSSSDAFDAGEVTGDQGAQTFRTLENLQFDSVGNAFAIFDTTNGSGIVDRGIVVLHQLADRNGGSFDPNRDRVISGAGSQLTSPKGIELVDSRGVMIVADLGNDSVGASLQVYSTAAGSDVAPLFSVTDTGSAAIWDIDYDPQNDRLYAAGTAGDILVYDNFMMSAASAVPSRSIQPATAGTPSNIHGIAYVESTDQIIATDVGDAASAEDGLLYVIDNAMSANGSVTPRVTISGPDSMLGNPVDLAFDGSNALIAEKSNDALLVYNNILDLTGNLSVAADDIVPLSKPEGVSLLAQ